MTAADEDGRKNNKPPVANQFKPGQSGNPRGRPKNTSIDIDRLMSEEAKRLITAIDRKDKKVQLTKVEAAAHQIVNKALQGDNKAIAVVLSLAAKLKEVGALEETTVVQFTFASTL